MFYPMPASSKLPSRTLRVLAFALAAGLNAYAQNPAALPPSTPGAKAAVGIFDGHGDLGIAPAAGESLFDADKKTYAVTGGGNNLWAKVDAGHFAWKKLSGDFSLAADIAFLPNATGAADPHRKACLMIRQSLDADSAYVDASLHGDGLTALQFRDAKGEPTREVMSNVVGPLRMRLEKHGDTFTLFVGQAGEDPKYSGASYILKFQEPFYVGLVVNAHNGNDTSLNRETAAFSRVELKTNLPATTPKLYSTLETQVSNPVNANQTQNTDRAVLYVTPGSIEGPVWLPDNSGIVFSRGGQLFRLPMRVPVRPARGAAGAPAAPAAPASVLGASPLATGEPVLIDTGAIKGISRTHGLSPDGTQLIFVDHPQGNPRPPANTYIVPIAGGTPRLLTPNTGAGSSLSPDGKTFAFDTDTVADIFTIPTDGSAPAIRLTNGAGKKNYGPQFTRDGAHIVFCSDRSGTMQIWWMKPDGSEPQQLTNDENNNWFPRLSGNDASALFVTYPKSVTGDPANSPVQIRRLNLSNPARTIDLMARVLGGPASAPTWSPSNAQITFVSYQMVH